MKKKTLLLAAVAVMLVATMSIGGMLAYFTDTDGVNNTFTVGKVDIDLVEDFDADNAKLMPGVDVRKGVSVKVAEDSEDTYVRVHIAIPQILDDGADDFNAANNLLHFNFTEESVAEGQWNWKKPDGNWNYYETEMNGITYNVYVVTYETALKAGETTKTEAMNKVYMDRAITNELVEKLSKDLGDEWNIVVIAEGGQVAGFEDVSAYEALNTQFGEPTSTDNPFLKAENEVEPF